jgi:hypothetical protein
MRSLRKSVAGLLAGINTNGLRRYALPMTIAEVCDHFIQRELTGDNLWRSYSTKRAYKGLHKKMDRATLGRRTSFRSENNGSGVLVASFTTREE